MDTWRGEQGVAYKANLTYFLWTSNPVYDLSLEDRKQLNQSLFIQETLAHGGKFWGVKLNKDAIFLIFPILLYQFPSILIIYPYKQYSIPFSRANGSQTYALYLDFGVKMSIFAFTPQMKSAGLYFRKKNLFLLHIILFLRINYKGMQIISYVASLKKCITNN